MEEQKKNSKEVKMNTAKKADGQPQKYTYDELNEIASRLFNENRYLKNSLQQAENAIRSFERLDYIFRVVELSSKAGKYNFSDDFVGSCIQEIEQALTVPEQQEETSKSEEN